MRIYISGKVTGEDPVTAWQKFDAVETALIKQGFEVINPLRVVMEFPNQSWKFYMKVLLPYLFDCEAIYLLNDWPASKGAKIERNVALQLDMLLLTEYTLQPGEVKKYLDQFLLSKYELKQN